MSQYSAVYVGYPVWCTDIPPAVQSFLAKCDRSGKTGFAFFAYYYTKWSSSFDTLKRLCPRSRVFKGVAAKGVSEKVLRDEVSEWLGGLGKVGA